MLPPKPANLAVLLGFQLLWRTPEMSLTGSVFPKWGCTTSGLLFVPFQLSAIFMASTANTTAPEWPQ
jgi:hypothetical protein